MFADTLEEMLISKDRGDEKKKKTHLIHSLDSIC